MATLVDVIKLINAGNFSRAQTEANTLSKDERSIAMKNISNQRAVMEKKGRQGEIAKKTISSIKDIALAFDQSNASLMKQNLGLAANIDQLEKLNQQTLSLKISNVSLLASFDELNNGMLALEGTMGARLSPGFDKMRKQLGQQALIWNRFGVGVQDSAEYMNEFNTTLGMSPKGIGVLGRQLQSFAVGTGQSFNQVLQDYNANLNQFAGILDSGEMTRQMMLLGASSKRMGMNLSEAMRPLQQFETMAGAQQAGAKLNQTISALGGTFDSVKASMMDYPERMDYIAQTVQSVMPRIRAAGPRAQRLYMRSLSQSLGMSASQIRKLANFEVGGGRAFERQLAQGVMPQAMSAGMERQLARGMMSYSDMGRRMKGMGGEAVTAALLRGGGLMGAPTTTVVPRALRMGAGSLDLLDRGEQLLKIGAPVVQSYLKSVGIDGITNKIMDKSSEYFKTLDSFTATVKKRLDELEHRVGR